MNAKEMFEELGYMRDKRCFYPKPNFDGYDICELKYSYSKNAKKYKIDFDLMEKLVVVENKKYFSANEIAAINQQCKELGWLESEKE